MRRIIAVFKTVHEKVCLRRIGFDVLIKVASKLVIGRKCSLVLEQRIYDVAVLLSILAKHEVQRPGQ